MDISNNIFIFLTAFTFALLWNRLLFIIIPGYFMHPFVRSTIKLRWHHLHLGILLIFLGTAFLLFTGGSTVTIVLLALGLGLVFDLFIPSLQLETDRGQELIVYKASLGPTLLLGLLIMLIILGLNFLLAFKF